MHFIMANLVYIDGDLQTPVARHLAYGTKWNDTISGDGKTVLTIIPGNITDDEVIAIQDDPDVIDYLEINRALNLDLPPAAAARVMRLAEKHGFPIDALPANPTVRDVRNAVVKRMRFSQAIEGADLSTLSDIKSMLRRRLDISGFDVSDIEEGDDEPSIRRKVLRHRPGQS